MLPVYTKLPIKWKPKMQKTTALSAAEAAALTAGCEVLYLRDYLEKLGFKQKKFTPIYGPSGICRPSQGGPWIRIRRMSGSGPMSEDKVHAVESWRVSTSVFAAP
jgi:hypothetical protein